MIDRKTKLRFRRTIRKSKRQVEDIGIQAEDNIEKHFFRRFSRLIAVRRFAIGWVVLIVVLIIGVVLQMRAADKYHTSLKPVAGGTYKEGLVGSFTNANPIYATGLMDTSVAKLIFSSLLKVDGNGQLVGDLAEKWTVDDRGLEYTVYLRYDLSWHDKKPLTADDVLFTYKTIQNADAKSPLLSAWQGIKVTSPKPRVIVFTLPSSLAAFPYSMTNGIVPKHILENVPVNQLRSASFNTVDPIGSGPFSMKKVQVYGDSPQTRQEQIGLAPFDNYHAGKPKLNGFVVQSFRDQTAMVKSFENGELNAMVGLDKTPQVIKKDASLFEYNIPIAGEVVVFLKNSSPVFTDVAVRKAIVQSIDKQQIVSSLGYPVAVANSPLLNGQVGYDKSIVQLTYNAAAAGGILDAAGWPMGNDGIREKAGKKLSFVLVAPNTSEYSDIAKLLIAQWSAIGVKANVRLQTDADLKGAIAGHEYEALLYGISIGADPDVFAYWHSSQADPKSTSRLNFSEYKSVVADKSLEAGRSRSDPAIRSVKYRPFLEAWRNDAPANVIYQPRFLYIAKTKVYGLDFTTISESSERFTNVSNWMILQGRVSD